jgi:hypothetical protein
MNAPKSTEHPITFPTPETWRDNPRLSSGQAIATLLNKSGFVVPKAN